MRRARWRCYWRWPLGHRWERIIVDQRHAYKRCAGCGKAKGGGYRGGGPADFYSEGGYYSSGGD